VNGVNGSIFLPDEFDLPDDVPFNSGVADYNGAAYYKTKNEYTAETWTKLEKTSRIS